MGSSGALESGDRNWRLDPDPEDPVWLAEEELAIPLEVESGFLAAFLPPRSEPGESEEELVMAVTSASSLTVLAWSGTDADAAVARGLLLGAGRGGAAEEEGRRWESRYLKKRTMIAEQKILSFFSASFVR